MSRLHHKIAIVTGAAQGIGAAYARALAAEGAKLGLCDLATPTAIADEIVQAGGEALAQACDVTNRASVEAFVAEVQRRFGGVHILVNNAGLFANLRLKSFVDIDDTEWDRVMAVNVRGSFECARAVFPAMKRQGYGKIINIASGTVFKGAPLMLHYVSSKGAVVGMTRALAREVGDHGICVNCLAPGLTMSEGLLANQDWAGPIVSNNIASRCIKREAQPKDLTGAMLFLASPESDFMSGQTVVVDGGSVTH
jgi:NAD(P)-dependent dehydrogenase (short-subunit alcohol dehydrogenase family)